MNIRCLAASVAASVLLVFATPASASDTILSVTGKVTDGEINLTLEQVEAMGSTSIVTTTPWHDGLTTFEGVPMARFLDAVGAQGTTAYVHALNDFSIDIPLSDLTRFDAIMAFKTDGEYMGIAEKGPLFIVFPYDDVREVRNELFYARSVWQIHTIEIE
ncbi:oxidoreductase [Lutimaribacter sp. EGI FJ00014]|uniref:Oxidoreductase n=1 Tax=Lutimaribacter degradans TaxID=2945989 RepID=A0ACC5ZW07_9RHOB|nr:oxidoreductase [Lutimaribacter sp. EGI FJ00013]MCM2561744.1 oxidoreductase [Lutimaribacter sp. EGI FJ00013]MCO0635202.1 oxidoreductase [Lutimaribacter sp. EGI FJ00014]